jgi:hypothetical protein
MPAAPIIDASRYRMSKISGACPDLLRAKELGMKEAEAVWNKICNSKTKAP